MTDKTKRLYRKKQSQLVTAVQLDLVTQGFTFEKWGGTQHCDAGDWLVKSENDCYCVADDVFRKTYREVSPGRFSKHGLVRAAKANSPGRISTREGETSYQADDYLVENEADASDTYAISAARFHELYELVNETD